MLNPVSGVSFRGDVAPAQNTQDLISAPSQFAGPVADTPADSFEKAGGEKKKSKAPAIIGGLVALAAAAYIGLGIAVGKGKLPKIEGTELKFMEKAQNLANTVGESAGKVWKSITGLFSRNAAKAADDATNAAA